MNKVEPSAAALAMRPFMSSPKKSLIPFFSSKKDDVLFSGLRNLNQVCEDVASMALKQIGTKHSVLFTMPTDTLLNAKIFKSEHDQPGQVAFVKKLYAYFLESQEDFLREKGLTVVFEAAGAGANGNAHSKLRPYYDCGLIITATKVAPLPALLPE